MTSIPIQTVLVPQGAEYAAVCRGLRKVPQPHPQVIPIPIGIAPTTQQLTALLQISSPCQTLPGSLAPCLLMGLGGSLVPHVKMGDGVLGSHYWVQTQTTFQSSATCDPDLTRLIKQRLGSRVHIGTGVTCDRILCTPSEKDYVYNVTQADFVDMEGSAVLTTLAPQSVAILRVISDTHDQILPNLSPALTPNGTLKALPMALCFIKQPLAALALIRGALQGLHHLQMLTTALFE